MSARPTPSKRASSETDCPLPPGIIPLPRSVFVSEYKGMRMLPDEIESYGPPKPSFVGRLLGLVRPTRT